MDKNTLFVIKNLDFNQIMAVLLEPNDSAGAISAQLTPVKVIVLVALTTGLPISSLINLSWDAVLEHDYKGAAACKDNFELNRHYNFPISKKIRSQLIKFHLFLEQPNYKTPIAKKFKGYEKFNNWYVSINFALGMRKIEELGMDTILSSKNEDLTQLLFGRRVLEVCGYSQKTSSLLKGLFKINTNKELFDFLGYESKEQIKYELSNVSIIEGENNRFQFGEPRSFLTDNKHFYNQIEKSNKYYPFYHFQVFYEFLKNLNLSFFDTKTQGVLVLLMLSLTNGIRPSSLLNLKWSDVFEIKKANRGFDCSVMIKPLKLGRHQIKLDQHTINQIKSQFELLHTGCGVLVGLNVNKLSFPSKAPNLNQHCFVTNRLNVLTQPSLHREIKNALSLAGFQHAEKFTTKSTMIMYGRRVIEIKGNHPPTLRALKKHFNFRRTQDLFKFLYISNKKGSNIPDIGEFNSVFEHVLYDI